MTLPRSFKANFTSRWRGNATGVLRNLTQALARDLRRPPTDVRVTLR